jgi:hypothetical protein
MVVATATVSVRGAPALCLLCVTALTLASLFELPAAAAGVVT